jgi:NADH-quinone oxidoreductase subunit N
LNRIAETLASLSGSLPGLLPELALAVLFIFLILLDLFLHHRSRTPLAILTGAGLALVLCLLVYQSRFAPVQPDVLFFGLLRADGLSVYLRALFLLAGIFALMLAAANTGDRQRANRAEYLAPLIALLLGAHLMAMSTGLLMLYLSVELVSLSSYILTAHNRDAPAAEGGIKYLLFGATSSAVMLYGMSWLYGFTGSLSFTDPTFYESLGQMPRLPLLVSLFLTLGGLLFKISAVPFHIWAPDIYQAAPLPVAAFFSVVPKAAGLGVLLRLAGSLNPQGFPDLPGWQTGLCVIILLTLTVGNFAALRQPDARRMLAYSSVAHAGFLLIGVVAGNDAGTESLLFYLGIYLFMNLAAFGLVSFFSQISGSERIESFAGLGSQRQLAAVATVVVMVALAGLPPTAGFTAKLLIFSSLWESWQASGNVWLLAVFGIGLLNVAVSLFYYLKIPFYLFFRPVGELNGAQTGIYGGLLIAALTLPVVVFFFKPEWLFRVITNMLE